VGDIAGRRGRLRGGSLALTAATGVRDDVVRLVRRHGPLPVETVVERALYAAGGETSGTGFYESGGVAGGRGGDFLTSPEVGPLFGAVVARALDGWWRAMGSPDPFVVVEAGAGPGTLCRSVLAAGPDCTPALRYVLVERSAAQRRHHAERLRIEDPALAFAPVDRDTDQPVVGSPTGPITVSLAALPRVAGPAVVLANELVDNLPFGLAERQHGRWCEVRVDWEDAPAVGEGRFVERLVPLDDERTAMLARLAPDPPDGARVPLQDAARRWLRDALGLADVGGRVAVIDYGTRTAALAGRPQDEWLRTYRDHARGGGYLADLGAQDVTAEVAFDQLALVRTSTADRSQADWLRDHGLDELVDDARRTWSERAHVGDLAALTARSRVSEAAALTDPSGLGAFRVLEWG
jgi:NADH dehydrogenase [ubiquinone] 1 alpha subcomplex assembly factor 7